MDNLDVTWKDSCLTKLLDMYILVMLKDIVKDMEG